MTAEQEEFDSQVFEDLRELMGEKFALMLETYLENSAKYIKQAEEALGNGNAQDVANSVHPLKSSSASLGIINVAELAKQIEEQARGDGKDLSEVKGLMESLKASFANIEAPLRQEISNASGAN